MDSQSQQDEIAQCSQTIYDGFIRYNDSFHRITRRARLNFEQRNWQRHQKDLEERIDIYEKSVRRVVLLLRRTVKDGVHDKQLWHHIKQYFSDRLIDVPDADFIKTFFNSITRRIFGTEGVDRDIEIICEGPAEEKILIMSLSIRRYPYWGLLQQILETILTDFSFRVPYANFQHDAGKIAQKIESYVSQYDQRLGDYLSFEFVDSIFYQSERAYIVGRIILSEGVTPIVIALKNEGKISVDAIFLSEREISLVFSYTRSYYFADPKLVVGVVHFLHAILPNKPIDELYTVLGRLRQGKAERYRLFSHHLKHAEDKFVHADGDMGLVMIVFTLPSYNLVFKIIRDKFGYPKTASRADVIGKYKLVSKHDHAGRLIDTQKFLNLKFPVHYFSDELLEDLLAHAKDTVRQQDQDIIIKHVYIERRVRPLNLYIQEQPDDIAEAAVIDYGQTIKDLAQTNIFTGDLLLKNFGVTRHRRVIFYDYDEVSLITDCQFRDIPSSQYDEDDMRHNDWYYVGDDDIFPEEFIRFLSMSETFKEVFMEHHGDLLTADYWRKVKAKQVAGDMPLIVPYTTARLA